MHRTTDEAARNDAAQFGVEPIAIVGVACRLPGARDAAQFWENLIHGVESIRLETLQQQAARGVSEESLRDPGFVPAVSLVDDFEYFDAAFFGMSAREAELRDPQQRMFLELAYTALEDAGYDPFRYPGDIGVYAGSGDSSYEWLNERRNARVMSGAGTLAITLNTHPDYLATFTSYKLNLRGPSLTVHTACSTSLVTLHLACEALRGGECDMTISGAVSVDLPLGYGYPHAEGGIYSPDGHIRPFDARAGGTIWGHGGGVVVLKRLSDALADGDHIRALVLGNAVNNDGAAKVGFTAPSQHGQAAVVAQALGVADVDPRSITYVEAHGTGTELGDPIEIAGLTSAYGANTSEVGWCAIGSVKANIGHTGPAAGVASVIKTTLALEHGLIPPSLNYEQPNPKIDFASGPFYVSSALTAWKPNGTPRRAGVSSFGMGGTNSHVIMEEAPRAERPPAAELPAYLLPLSARTESALGVAAQRLAGRLGELAGGTAAAPRLADVAYTLRVGRREHEHRLAVVARDLDDAVAALGTPKRWIRGSAAVAAGNPADQAPGGAARSRVARVARVALMFSGQGAQYPGMGGQLYQALPVFREAVDECAGLLGDLGGRVRAILLDPGPAGDDAADEALRQTELTQPALFVLEYSLARLWESWGIEPDSMVGHSIGEYVAATLAGVFQLPAALDVVAARGRLMQAMPPGAMLAVQLGEEELRERLPDGVSIAVVNGPGTCVVAGPGEEVRRFGEVLSGDDIGSRPLRTSHAFHSAMMDPVIAEFREIVAAAKPAAPARPFLSNVTGEWITPADASDPSYWARHLREPVRFGDCVRTLLADGRWMLVECGPGRQLCGLARLNGAGREAVLPSVAHRGEKVTDAEVITASAGRLWAEGAGLDLASFGAPGYRVPLPTYPWERKYFWIHPDPGGGGLLDESAARRAERRALPEWFAAPTWHQLPPHARAARAEGRILVFADGAAAAIAGGLAAAGAEVVVVRPGPAFDDDGAASFAVRPSVREDYDELMTRLAARGGIPPHVVHAWTLTSPSSAQPETVMPVQDIGFFSLLSLVQALAGAPPASGIRLDVLTAGTQDVTGKDLRCPEHATVIGVAKVAPLEMPWLAMRHLDLDPDTWDPGTGQAEPAAPDLAELIGELLTADDHGGQGDSADDADTVALRGGRRWRRRYADVVADEPADAFAGASAGGANAAAGGGPGARLREGGVYVITGGLGGIGITVAEDLATRLRARLVLLSRSDLPPRAEWDTTLAVRGSAERTGRAITAIRRMESAGAEVLVLPADVSSVADLRQARDQIMARFGRVDGIVHAAGVPGGGMAEIKDHAAAAAVLAPKLAGTAALREIFGGADLDFVVLCSSVYAVTGGFGQVDYCAANNFMDAFARGDHGWRAPVISVNWGGWLEVGMSAEVSAPPAFRALQRGDRLSPLHHPVLRSRCAGDDHSPGWCGGVVSAGSHWLLSDHRIAGVPVIPGTGHLETVRAAFEATVPAPSADHVVELRDVAFTEPMSVPEGTAAELRVMLAAGADGLDFEVVSLTGGNQRTHARGSVAWVDAAGPPLADLGAIRERCSLLRRGGGEVLAVSSSLVTFGPHWGNLKEIHSGETEELALLEASAAVATDLAQWPLHPSLLDEATAFGRGDADEQFLPLGYGRITIRGPIPARVWSHLRHRDAGTREVRSCDIALIDDAGRELVSIGEFTMRRVDAAALAARLGGDSAAGETASGSPALSGSPAHGGSPAPGGAAAAGDTLALGDSLAASTEKPAAGPAGAGMRPAEGAECLRRILAGDLGPQVVVSVQPIAEIIAAAREFTEEAIESDLDVGALGQQRSAEDGYVAPRTELERAIARIWGDVLGGQVGVTENFFDLGGNSLIAVQLVSTVRKEMGIRIPMRSIFEVPTVAGAAALIESLRDGQGGGTPDQAQPGGTSIPRLPRADDAAAEQQEQ